MAANCAGTIAENFRTRNVVAANIFDPAFCTEHNLRTVQNTKSVFGLHRVAAVRLEKRMANSPNGCKPLFNPSQRLFLADDFQ